MVATGIPSIVLQQGQPPCQREGVMEHQLHRYAKYPKEASAGYDGIISLHPGCMLQNQNGFLAVVSEPVRLDLTLGQK